MIISIIRLLKLADKLDQQAFYKEASLIDSLCRNLIASDQDSPRLQKLFRNLGLNVEETSNKHLLMTFRQPVDLNWIGTCNLAPHNWDFQTLLQGARKDLNSSLRKNFNSVKKLVNGNIFRFSNDTTKVWTNQIELKDLLQRTAAIFQLDGTDKAIIDYWINTGEVLPRVNKQISTEDVVKKLIDDHNQFKSKFKQNYINQISNEELEMLFKELEIHGRTLIKYSKELVKILGEKSVIENIDDISRWLTIMIRTYRLQPIDTYNQINSNFDEIALLALEQFKSEYVPSKDI